jgi:hypothetical protein
MNGLMEELFGDPAYKGFVLQDHKRLPSVVAEADAMSNAAGFDGSTALSMPWAKADWPAARNAAAARRVVLMVSPNSIESIPHARYQERRCIARLVLLRY